MQFKSQASCPQYQSMQPLSSSLPTMLKLESIFWLRWERCLFVLDLGWMETRKRVAASWKEGGKRGKTLGGNQPEIIPSSTQKIAKKALKIVSSEPPELSQKLAIFTIFHHPNHFEFFTKVVPKTLICLENQLSPTFHLICHTVRWRHQEAENCSFGILEARRSEDWGS